VASTGGPCAPTHPTTAGEHTMSVASGGDQVLLLADEGGHGRLWSARGA
jgi:hypothetical protein